MKTFGVLVGLLSISAGLLLISLGLPHGPGNPVTYPNTRHVSTIDNPGR